MNESTWLRKRVLQLEMENEELRREKTEWVDLTMKGEAVRHRVMLELVLGTTLTK